MVLSPGEKYINVRQDEYQEGFGEQTTINRLSNVAIDNNKFSIIDKDSNLWSLMASPDGNIYTETETPTGESYTEITRTNNRVSDIITWTDSGKTQKIREENYTYTDGILTSYTILYYDGSGILNKTETYTINRTNGFITSESMVVS